MQNLKNVVILVTLLSLLLSAGAVSAQDPRDAGIFADEAGTQSTLTVEPFVPFDFHAIAFGLDGNVHGFEFGLYGWEELTVLTVMTWPDPRVGIDIPPGEFITYIGQCVTADPAGPFWMATLTVGSFMDPTGENLIDKAICVRGSRPSSFEEFGSPPGWLRCDGTLHPFGVAQSGGGVYPDGCMILNPTSPGSVISTETTSFGAIKTRF